MSITSMSAGRYAYLSDDLGLNILDVADPTHPNLIGYFETPGNAYGVDVDENYTYVVGDNGLYILRTIKRDVQSIEPAGGSLSSVSGDIQLIFPSGAFTQTAEVTCKHLLVDQDTASLLGIGATFELAAVYSDTLHEASLAPARRLPSRSAIPAPSLARRSRNSLALYDWDGSQWAREPTSRLRQPAVASRHYRAGSPCGLYWVRRSGFTCQPYGIKGAWVSIRAGVARLDRRSAR